MYQRACCAPLSVLSLANPGLAFLRYAFLLRLEDRGRPSVACPFAGRSTFPGSPTPVRRVPFFACPKQGTERKGTPDSAPANFAGSLAPHSSQTVRVRAFLRSRFPLALLERPVRTVRGAPARRGGDSLDPRLFFCSPLALARTREIPLAPLRACSSSLCLTRLE